MNCVLNIENILENEKNILENQGMFCHVNINLLHIIQSKWFSFSFAALTMSIGLEPSMAPVIGCGRTEWTLQKHFLR